MSNIFDQVEAKLIDMKQYCLDQCDIDCDPEHLTGSKNAYQNAIDSLQTSINNYYDDIDESVFKDIIIFDFINVLMSDIEYNFSILKPSMPYPDGYNDYLEIYGVDGLLEDILGYDVSYYYDGCIIGIEYTPEPTPEVPDPEETIIYPPPASITNDILKANNAHDIDEPKRTSLSTYYKYFPQMNTLMMLTEDIIISSGSAKTKTATGTIIYIDKHAKDIIEKFDLDIYIPSYAL